MAFEQVAVHEVPPQIKEAVQKAREEDIEVYVVEDTAFIVVTRGKKPTAGYGVKVAGIEGFNRSQDGHSIDIYVEYNNPEPEQPVAQVVTYPYAIVKIDMKDIPKDTLFRFFVDGTERPVYSTQLSEQ